MQYRRKVDGLFPEPWKGDFIGVLFDTKEAEVFDLRESSAYRKLVTLKLRDVLTMTFLKVAIPPRNPSSNEESVTGHALLVARKNEKRDDYIRLGFVCLLSIFFFSFLFFFSRKFASFPKKTL